MEQHIIATQSADDTNSLCSLEQYKKYSAKFLRQRLKEKIFQGQKLQADSTTVFASILFADISGFTRLSSRLSCEELKTHINEYFTKLLGIIDENNGDVVKFCGDAVMIMWAVPIDATETVKSAVVTMSALCALQLLEECGVYKKYIEYTDSHLIRSKSLGARAKTSINSRTFIPVADVNNSNDSPPPASTTPTTPLRTDTVELSLHCGIACGEVHCMVLGDTQRREFLLSGQVLQYMGEAEALAQAGQVCMHSAAYQRIQDILHAEPVRRPAGTSSGGHMPSASVNEATASVAAPTTAVVDGASTTVVTEMTPAHETAEVFLLTGRLSERLYQRRTQPSRSSASSTITPADPSALRLDSCSLGTTLPLTSPISTELHSTEGVSTNTARYLASLAQELTTRTPHPRLSHSGHTTPTQRRSVGAEGGRAAARHGEGRSFLSRFNGSPLRCSLPGPVHDQDSAVLEVGEEQVSDTSDLDSPCRSRGTEQGSFLTPSVSPLAQSDLPGDLARRPLRSRMSAALSHTRSSLGFLQVSWSSIVSSPSTRTYTTNQAPLLTAGGEEGLGADPSAGLRCCSEERSDTEQTDCLSPAGLDSSPGSPTAAALSSTRSLSKRQRRLPVAVLKKKLKYNTTTSFATVRMYQNNWQQRSVLSTTTEHYSTSNSLLGCKSESSELLLKNSSQFVTQTGAKRARLSRELCKFMHESAVRAIEAGTVACLSEVRDVAVVFTQLHDLDKEFKMGTVARPQKVFCALLRTLRQHGGSLRQFVVDDKGCVAIACFGLAGSCNQNNCVSAVEYAVSLRTLLQTLGCRTSSGVTLGRLYCGLVGAGSRCEYAVMGSSVNLAARLMSAAATDVTASVLSVAPVRDTAVRRRSSHSLQQQQHRHSVLVDSTVYAETQHHFQYRQMAHIIAKGYTEPVQVFATVRKLSQPALLPASATVECSVSVQSRDCGLPGARTDDPAPPVLMLEREDQLSTVRRAFIQSGTSPCSTSVPCLLVTGPVGVGRSTFLQHVLSVLPPQHCIATVKVDPANQYLSHDLVRELLCQVLGIPSGATIRELTLTSSTTAAATGTEDSHQTPPSPSLTSSPQLQPRRDSAARASIPSLRTVSTVMVAAIKFQQQTRAGKLRNTARSQRRATETPAGIQSSIPMAVAPLSRCCSSSYLNVSTERLPLLQNMHCTTDNTKGTVHNSDTAASAVPLSPHTVKYTPKRQQMQNSPTSLIAACTSDIAAAEELTRRRDVNTKIQTWCEQHLPCTFTLSQAFAACHPQLDFCDALSTHLQSTHEGCTEDHNLCTQALQQLSTWPLHSILYLLNPILNSTLVCESPQLLQLLAYTFLSEVEELLQEVLLEVLLLLALGVPLSGGVCADCCGTWVLAVDDLHLADQESQALLLRVIATTQRLTGTTHSPTAIHTAAVHPPRGGVLLALAVGGGCTDLTCTQEAAAAHTRTSAGTSPRRTTQCSKRYAQLRTSLCMDSVALCALRDSSDLSPERLLELLKLHCECVSLSLLSKAATERILQETLGPQHWRWLLNNACAALGTIAATSAPVPGAATATTGLPALPRLSLHGVGTLIVHRRRRRSTVLSPSCLLGITEGNTTAPTTTLSGSRCSSKLRLRSSDAFLPGAHNCDTLCSSVEQDSIVELIFTLAQKGLASAVTDICTSLRETIVSGVFCSIQQVPAVERRSKLILEVLDRLYSLDVAVLKAAAVVGTDFDIPLLSVTLAGMDLPQCTEVAVLVPALRRLMDAGLLKTVLHGAHFTGTTVTKLDERTYTNNSEPESGHFAFAEAATQLVVYNLMLDTQRSTAHSVVAAYLEHRYRCHCTHTQLFQIAQQYFLSSNITKKLEYMRRTAEYYASSGDNSSAVDMYAELVLLATGSTLERLLELCQCRELAAIHTLTALLTTAAQPGSCASSSSTTPPQLQMHSTINARPNLARTSWRHRLFHNQVAVAAGDQARERSLSKQELRDRVGAMLSVPASTATSTTTPAGAIVGLSALPMPGVHPDSHINSSSDSQQGNNTLSKLILHRRALRRKVALNHHCSTALPLPCTPTPTIPAIAVRTCVGILGITLVDVAVWIGNISDLLFRSGEQEEGVELSTVCLHLFDCTGVVEGKPAVSPTPQMSRTMQSQCSEDCIEEMSASTEGTECLDAHTRSALEFLDQETESYHRQQQQQQQALTQTQIGGSRSAYSSSLLRPVVVLARFLQLSTKTQHRTSTSSAVPHNSSSALRPLSPPCSLINTQEITQLSATVDSIISERDRHQQGRWTRRRTTRLSPKPTTTTAMPAPQCPAAAVDTLRTEGVLGCPVLQALLTTPHHPPSLPTAEAVHRQLAVLQGLAEHALQRGDSLAATLLLEETLCTLSAATLHSADTVWGHDAALLSQQYTQCMCMLSIALRHCCSAEAAISHYQRALCSRQQAPLSCSLLSTAGRHLAASGQLHTAIKCLCHAQTAQQYHHHSHTVAPQLQLLFEQIWLQVLVGNLSSADQALAGFQQQLQALSVGGSSDSWQQQRHWAQQLQVLLEIAHGGSALEEVGLQKDSAGAGLQGGSTGSGADPQQDWAMEVLSVYRSVVTALEYGYAWRPVPPPSPYSSKGGASGGQHAALLTVTLTRLRTPQHDHLNTTSSDTTNTSGTNSKSVVSGASSVITGILEFLCIYVSIRELDAVMTQSSGPSASLSDTQLLLSIALLLSQRLAQFDTLTSTCCAGLRPLYTILCVQYELYFYALCAYCGIVTTSNCSSARQGVKQDPGVRQQHIHTLQHIVETVFKPPSFRLTKACLLTDRRCVIKPSASVSGNLALRSAGQLSSWTGWWQRLYNKAFSSAYTDDINDPIYVLATMASTAAASSSSSRNSSSATISSAQLPVCLREYGNGFSVVKLQRLRAYLQYQLTAATTVVADCDMYASLTGLSAELAQGAADSKDSAAGRSGVQGKSSEERSSCRTTDSGSVATSNRSSSSSRSSSGSNSSALPHTTTTTTTKARPSSSTTARLLSQYSTTVNVTTNTGTSAAELCFTDVNVEKHSWECLPFITPLYEHLLRKIDVTEENCREELFIYVERLMERMQT